MRQLSKREQNIINGGLQIDEADDTMTALLLKMKKRRNDAEKLTWNIV